MGVRTTEGKVDPTAKSAIWRPWEVAEVVQEQRAGTTTVKPESAVTALRKWKRKRASFGHALPGLGRRFFAWLTRLLRLFVTHA